MNDEHREKKANGWVFISYSSTDYESVKIVRNYLEESGFSALMFYLKSLENPKNTKLTQQLIKWEIESQNYLSSTWAIKKMEMSLSLALEHNARVLPIIIDNVDISNIPLLNNIKYISIDLENFEEKKRELLLVLKRLEES